MDNYDDKKCFAVIAQVVIVYFAVTMVADFVLQNLLCSVDGLSRESRLTVSQFAAVMLMTVYFVGRYKNTIKFINKNIILKIELPFILMAIIDMLMLSIIVSNITMRCFPASAVVYNQRFGIPVGNMMIITIIWAVIAAPILEEIMCRGIVFKSLRYQHGFMVSACISSLVWALLHMSIVQGVITFILGFLMAFIMEKFDSLVICIVAHMLNNCLAFVPFNKLDILDGVGNVIAEIMIMMLIVLGSTFILMKHKVINKKTALQERPRL